MSAQSVRSTATVFLLLLAALVLLVDGSSSGKQGSSSGNGNGKDVVTTDQHGVTRYNGHTHVDAREWALNNPGKGMPPKDYKDNKPFRTFSRRR